MPPPSSCLVLLGSRIHPPGDDTSNIRGSVLTSGAKLAFGFSKLEDDDEDPNSVVRDLDLEAQLAGATGLSFLTLQGGVGHYSAIHTVDKNLILIGWSCMKVYPMDVILIYDAMDRSLRMIPFMPHSYPPFSAHRILVARRHDNDKSYALVFPGTSEGQAVLLLALPSASTSPWETTKKANFPDNSRLDKDQFDADDVFSFRGRGYWVDLLRGVLYCDCSDVLSDDVHCVDIRSFDLPAGCEKYLGYRDDITHAKSFRAVGPVGDSIKFVSIDGYLEHVDLEDCKVTVWRLMDDLDWAVEYELKLATLWEGVEFEGDFVPPEMAPMYPILSTQEDSVIYFVLGTIQGVKKCYPTEPRCMLRVDWHTKTVSCTRLSDSQRSSIDSHIAMSSNAADKLLN